MKDYEYPPLALPVSENFGDLMLAGGINDMNSAFDVPNSEGKEMRSGSKKPKSIAIYCGSCAHHWFTDQVPDDWWNARVEKCANCLGTGGRCKKCDEENRAQRSKKEAA